jgi:hypothetical protein
MCREDLNEQQILNEGGVLLRQIEELVMNASYFINKLRRKQGLITLKKELSDAIEKRDEDTNQMKERIKRIVE